MPLSAKTAALGSLFAAALLGLRAAGRFRGARESVAAALLIALVGGGFAALETRADERARRNVERLFRLAPDPDYLAFDRRASHGTLVPRVDAVVAFTPERFDAYRASNPGLDPMTGVVFTFRSDGFGDLRIDRFAVAEGALSWKALPRAFRGRDAFFPERGHHSRRRTPDERTMRGAYLCAHVPVAAGVADGVSDGDAAPFPVIPCDAVTGDLERGVTVLAFLDETDRTLHVLIG